MANSPFWVAVARDAVQVSGPDALSYLQGQLSQELRPLAVGASRWTLLLQPNGRVDVLARVWRTADDTYVLDTDAGFGDELRARINRFRIRVKADVEPLVWRCLAVRGTDTERVPDGAVVGWWERDYDLLGPDPQPPEGIDAGSSTDLAAARIEAGWPAMGAEIVPGEQIPGETGVVPVAVDFKKGCYPGQELVERMDSRGAEAPRRLRILTVAEGSQPGDPVVHAGGEVGSLTSVAGTRALGYVKRGVDLGDAPQKSGAWSGRDNVE
jgi:tRNA-modifying protein YgfZ